MASGDTLLIFHPYNNEPTLANYATLDIRNQHPVLDFDPTTNEYAVFSAIMPQNYSGATGITVYIHYSMQTAIALTIDWDVAFERVGEVLDTDGDSFAAANSVDDTTVPDTSGLVDIVSIPFTNGGDMDSIAVGEKFRMKINRDAVSDDATGDAELHMIEIRET